MTRGMLRFQRLFCLAFVGNALLWAVPHPHKNVLVLVSDEPNMPAVAALTDALRTEFGRDDPAAISLFTEYLDLNRFDRRELQAEILPREKEKYRDVPLDLILCVSLPALRLTLAQRDRLWPGTPISFMGIDARDLEGISLPADVKGQATSYDFEGTARLALKLLPNTKHVAVVSGSAEVDRVTHQQMMSIVQRLDPAVDLIDEGGLSFDDLTHRLSTLPKETIVLWTEITQDREGRRFVPHDALAALVPLTNAPVFGAYGTYLGTGIVGGDLTDFRVVGHDAAVLCEQILYGGLKASAPAVERSGSQIKVDWRQLRRWNVPESALPPGTIVLYRQPTVWERYQKYILAGVVVIIVQALLIAGLLWQRARRRSAMEAMKNLGGLLIHAQEDERASIARELHDDFSQRLAVQSIELEQLGKNLPSEGEERERALRMLKETKEMSADMRSLSHQLHSSRLELVGLVPALSGLCQEITKTYGIAVRFTGPDAAPDFTKDAGLCLFRVAQEALANVVKHSQARSAHVELRADAKAVGLQIWDTGQGFDTGLKNEGIGLMGMRERLHLLGGRLSVRSKPMRGTVLLAEIPLSSSVKHPSRLAPGGKES